MSEKVSFVIRTIDFVKEGLLDNVTNIFLNDFDNNYIAMKNKQNFYQIYLLDLKAILGTLYDEYDYFNIILRQISTAGDTVIDDFIPLYFCISGFDWTNKQNIFPNEKMMGIGYLNDLSTRFSIYSLSKHMVQEGFYTFNRYFSVKRGFKTFRKQPFIDFKLFIRTGTTTTNEQSNELLLENTKIYFTLKFDIYPCKNI